MRLEWMLFMVSLLLLSGRPAMADAGDFTPRFVQQPGAGIPLDDPFRDETGQTVQLRDYMGRRPVILALVYYGCSNFCTLVLNGLGGGLKGSTQPFEVVAVSISPQDNPALAALKKRAYVARFPSAGAWHFLSGSAASIRALTASVGFHDAYEPARHEFSHPAGLVILTPTGHVARYLLGINFPQATLEASLTAAQANETWLRSAGFALGCFSHEPLRGPYSAWVMNGVRLISGAVAALLGLKLWTLFRAQPPSKREEPS